MCHCHQHQFCVPEQWLVVKVIGQSLTLIGCLHEWLVDVEDPSIVVLAKKQSRTHVVDNRSLTAMKASDGARAGIIFRSDTFGCDHWGVLDMLQHGQILLLHMKAYL